MKHLDPITDADLNDRKQAADDARTIYTLTLNDFLSEPLTVHGVKLDAKSDCWFKKINGEIELEGCDIGDVYIWVDVLPGSLMKLDQTHLKNVHKTLYEDFIAEVQRVALVKAKESFKWEFDDITEE